MAHNRASAAAAWRSGGGMSALWRINMAWPWHSISAMGMA